MRQKSIYWVGTGIIFCLVFASYLEDEKVLRESFIGLAGFVYAGLIIFYFWNANRGTRHLSRGEFKKAVLAYREGLKTLPKKKSKRSDSIKMIYLYNLGNALTWTGELEEAVSYLKQIPTDQLPQGTAWSYFYLRTLLASFLNHPLDEINHWALLAKREESTSTATRTLFQSYIEDLNGNTQIADSLMQEHKNSPLLPPSRKGQLYLPQLEGYQIHFFMASYFLKRNLRDQAEPHLQFLNQAPEINCYSQAAQRLTQSS